MLPNNRRFNLAAISYNIVGLLLAKQTNVLRNNSTVQTTRLLKMPRAFWRQKIIYRLVPEIDALLWASSHVIGVYPCSSNPVGEMYLRLLRSAWFMHG